MVTVSGRFSVEDDEVVVVVVVVAAGGGVGVEVKDTALVVVGAAGGTISWLLGGALTDGVGGVATLAVVVEFEEVVGDGKCGCGCPGSGSWDFHL